jgi:hypothetical protein
MALAWVAGVVAFPLTLLVAGDQLFLRVEIALVATVSVAAVVMFALLLRFLSAQRVFSPAGD